MKKFTQQITSLQQYQEEIEDQKDLRNYFYDELQECYKIVENYIKKNQRILVGGMAIDFALKSKGSFLYSKNKIDYDFISPDYHNDAYKLGNILATKFDNISVIGALHASTMRVRYNFMPVADITYMPSKLYEQMKTIDFNGFRCIHPHVQMADQVRSMVYMSQNPPRESFFGDRIKKDIKRFCMLNEFFPLLYSNDSTIKDSTIKDSTLKIVQHKIPLEYLQNNCLGGHLAAAFWSKKYNINNKLNIDINNSFAIVDVPDDAKITIYTDEPEKLLNLIGNKEQRKFRAILDKLPERIEIDMGKYTLEIFNSDTVTLLSEKTNDFHVIHLYGVLLYLLTYYSFEKPLSMTAEIHNYILNDFKNKLDTFPTEPNFYGKNNWSENYILTLKRNLIKSQSLLPKNAYPARNKYILLSAYEFDPTKSEFIHKDGSRV